MKTLGVVLSRIILIPCLLPLACMQDPPLSSESSSASPSGGSLRKEEADPCNTILRVLVNWNTDGSNRMFTYSPSEISPLEIPPPPANSLGQLAYVSDEPLNKALWRLYYGPPLYDHMGSINPSAENQNPVPISNGIHGYLWSQPDGGEYVALSPLRRYYNTANGDHDVGFTLPDGYSDNGILGYAHNRQQYGNTIQASELVNSTNGAPVIGMNKVAGGIIDTLNYKGYSYLNNVDFGRQIQIDMNLETKIQWTPNEGGDIHRHWDTPTRWSHGSPLVEWNKGTNTLWTVTRPLQWTPEAFYNIPPEVEADPIAKKHFIWTRPVLWHGLYEKEITLNYGGCSNVIKYKTTIHFPRAYWYVDMAVPNAFLRKEFNRFYVYDVDSANLIECHVDTTRAGGANNWNPDESHPVLRPGSARGGAILATANGSHALGLYHKDNFFQSYPYQGYCFTNWLSNPVLPNGQEDACTRVTIRASEYNPTQTREFTVYIVVGTLAEVDSLMRSNSIQ
jgi:hypothetical protein